jgi:hypothetical protein
MDLPCCMPRIHQHAHHHTPCRVVLRCGLAVQRSTIEKLVVLLGGTFCKTLGRQQRATHLMLPRWGPDDTTAAAAAGHGSSASSALPDSTVKKIAYAMKHGLEMVVSEWLLDCAAEGRRVQESLHRPDGDVNLLELPVGGRATQGAGLTQLPVTQMQQTQAQVGGYGGFHGVSGWVVGLGRGGATQGAGPTQLPVTQLQQAQAQVGEGVEGRMVEVLVGIDLCQQHGVQAFRDTCHW